MSRIATLMTVSVLLLPMLGCNCLDRPYTPLTHSPSWDPVLGSCGICGVCEGSCAGHTPASFMKHNLTCGSGCGEIYWDEWLSDPPDPCDPCDDCGNWIGPRSCCPPTMLDRVVYGWQNLWGIRTGCGSCDQFTGGCETCGKGGPVPSAPTKGGVIISPTGPIMEKAISGTPSPRNVLRSVRFAR